MLGQRPLDRDPLDRAAAEGHHRGRAAHLRREGVEDRDDEALLAMPELLLSLALEERLDRLAELPLEQLVGVDQAEPEPLGDGLRRPRLARPHEADEDEPVMGYRRHPMRSLYAESAESTSSMWSPPNFSR